MVQELRLSALGLVASDVWVYLAQTPLLWLTLTISLFLAAQKIFQKTGQIPLLHPVPVSTIALVALLLGTGTDYETYFDGAQFVHFLLGPATVALAVPLYSHAGKVKQVALPLTVALGTGCVVAIVSATSLASLCGLSTETVRSLAPKSVTTPIAMGITEQMGGIPSLTAVLVILTGITGAIIGRMLLRIARITDDAALGCALGLSAHGLGTAQAFELSEEAGAFSGLAMGLNGLLTALLIPLLAHYLW